MTSSDNKTQFRTCHTANFNRDGGPSCANCRKRFSTIFAKLIANNEWLLYVIVAFIKHCFETSFRAEKSGRFFNGCAWGALVDRYGRWGFAFEIINLTTYTDESSVQIRQVGMTAGLINAFCMIITDEQQNTTNGAKINTVNIIRNNFGRWAVEVNKK